jgi:hypothetical protein
MKLSAIMKAMGLERRAASGTSYETPELSCRNFAKRNIRYPGPHIATSGSRIFASGEFRDDSYFFFASSAAKVPPSAASFSISGAIFQRAPYLAS